MATGHQALTPSQSPPIKTSEVPEVSLGVKAQLPEHALLDVHRAEVAGVTGVLGLLGDVGGRQ